MAHLRLTMASPAQAPNGTNTMLHNMQKWARAYLDGLTTPKEFLGQMINEIGEEYSNLTLESESKEADDLAKLLTEKSP